MLRGWEVWLTGVGFLHLVRESGIGSRESGIRNRESGVGSRESGIGNREYRAIAFIDPMSLSQERVRVGWPIPVAWPFGQGQSH
ncbi:hypothetical protein [Moorena bouillonii]|uniref:hypothetical protein n=1 Tax=Moorena bouillonii TaxID=207920 RepID=UPI0013013946|nr:hypothetical protein [Moorena bouillonii]